MKIMLFIAIVSRAINHSTIKVVIVTGRDKAATITVSKYIKVMDNVTVSQSR